MAGVTAINLISLPQFWQKGETGGMCLDTWYSSIMQLSVGL
jgi:hypothetical protein